MYISKTLYSHITSLQLRTEVRLVGAGEGGVKCDLDFQNITGKEIIW